VGRQGTVLGSGVLKGTPESRERNVRFVAALLIVGVIAANVFAAAISFTGGSSLGVGTATIAACDTDGFSVKPVTAWVGSDTKFMISSLIIGSGASDSTALVINNACVGKTVKGIILSSGTSIGAVTAAVIASSNATGSVPLTLVLTSAADAGTATSYAFEIAD
jgi:hypothetical protein